MRRPSTTPRTEGRESADAAAEILPRAMGYVRALWVGASPTIALVLALTLPAVIVLANTLSTLIPLVAERLRIDPAVVSTPMIATLVDTIGILIYLSIAAALVGT